MAVFHIYAMWGWEYFKQYSLIFLTFKLNVGNIYEYYVEYSQSHIILLWICIMLCQLGFVYYVYQGIMNEMMKALSSNTILCQQLLAWTPLKPIYVQAKSVMFLLKTYPQYTHPNNMDLNANSRWTCRGSALKVKTIYTRECVLMAYPLRKLALK